MSIPSLLRPTGPTSQLLALSPKKPRKSTCPISSGRSDPLTSCWRRRSARTTRVRRAAPRDEDSRATAFFVLNYVQAFRPRWLVVENVIHMRPWSRYPELQQVLQGLGYHLREHVLDASHFGVPQARRRLYLVGDRDRQPPPEVAPKSSSPPTVESILDPPDTWRTSPLFHPRRAQTTLTRAERAFATLGPNASFLLVYYGTDGGGGWQDLGRPLRTVTTVDRFALVAHNGHEPRMRMLQVTELRRAMGLHPEFLFPVGTRRDQIRLLGNGVCPPVMTAVVGSLTG